MNVVNVQWMKGESDGTNVEYACQYKDNENFLSISVAVKP